MILSMIKWVAIAFYTIVLGLSAILLSFLLPGSDIVPLSGKLWSYLIIKTAGARLFISGMENIDREIPCVYISNHLSNFDVFALINILPARTRIIAKRSLFFVPIFGWSIYLAGYISVKRDDREGAMKSFEQAAEKIRKGRPILFFAEGARSPDGKLHPFKKGAFLIALKAGVPIIPISISGSHRVMPLKSFRICPGDVSIVIGKPIFTERYTVSSINILMEDARSSIAQNLKS
ncbi:MAG: lysophospholipid acyltransferase family protein [Acidobacteriota bacterium]